MTPAPAPDTDPGFAGVRVLAVGRIFMSGGYMGKVLVVDLTSGTQSIRSTEGKEGSLRKYLGGSGLAAKYLYDELPPDADPLGPENVLVFMTGPFCGTPVPTSREAYRRGQISIDRFLGGVRLRRPLGGHAQAGRFRRPHHPRALAIGNSRLRRICGDSYGRNDP